MPVSAASRVTFLPINVTVRRNGLRNHYRLTIFNKGEPMATIEDFRKIELVVAQIKEVKEHPNADRLYVIKVDTGKEERQVVAGIRARGGEAIAVGGDVGDGGVDLGVFLEVGGLPLALFLGGAGDEAERDRPADHLAAALELRRDGRGARRGTASHPGQGLLGHLPGPSRTAAGLSPGP